jgi:alanine racemase
MTESAQLRPTWAEISLPAVVHNYSTIKKHWGGRPLMAVVKADAYGHGATECARALEAASADWFGVALVEEAIALRAAGITRPIFCLGGFWRGSAAELIRYDLTPALFTLEAAEELNAAARAAGRRVSIHLKVDTGMGRLGVPVAEVAAFADAFARFDHLRLDGLLTHFADADAADSAYTDLQSARFDTALGILAARGFEIRCRHLANSAAIHARRGTRGDLARVGANLYGLVRDVLAASPPPPDLRPALALRSRLIMLKEVPSGTPLGYSRTFTTSRRSLIATLPIGYADGLRRAHSNCGRVMVRGHFAPIVGRVSMDLTIIDVTDIPGVALGDLATMIGKDGPLELRAEDLAAEIETVSYEIVCGISARVPRHYLR